MYQECVWKPQLIHLGLKTFVLIRVFLRECLDGKNPKFRFIRADVCHLVAEGAPSSVPRV